MVTVLNGKLCSLIPSESISQCISFLLKGSVICACCIHGCYVLFFRKDLTKENNQLLRHLLVMQRCQRTPKKISPNTNEHTVSQTCRSKYPLRSVCRNYHITDCNVEEESLQNLSEEELDEQACRVLFMSDSSDSDFEC